MKIEDQCVSLELAKKLKELGVRYKSVLAWGIAKRFEVPLLFNSETHRLENEVDEIVPAYTVAELGEMLPYWFDSGKRDNEDFICRFYDKNTDMNHWAFATTEADARAKMLIYLIENGYLKVDDL
jgi:hypothetical protein